MAERCAAASLDRQEPLVGTASTVDGFLLVECAGPWGVAALRDSRLPEEVKRFLRTPRGMRSLLIRRGGTSTTRVFTARAGRLRQAVLDDVRELLDLDLTRDLTPYDERLLLVCTHGRHDACCAERGRPLWKELHRVAPEQTWQVSHIGGDRFAGNVLVLPDGLYYGRVQPSDAGGFADLVLRGRLDLTHLRGRCVYPFAAQAAEIFLLRHLGEDRVDALSLTSYAEGVATFRQGSTTWRVRVEEGRGPAHPLTCKATRADQAPSYALGWIVSG